MNRFIEILKAIFISKFWIKAISLLLALFVVILLHV